MTNRYGRIAVLAMVSFSVAIPRSAAEFKVIRPESVFIPAYIVQSPQIDPRISALDLFFQKHKCPYKDTSLYLTVADKYSIDYRLLPAISVIEESCGQHNPVNNLFGYYGNGLYGLRPFKTIAEGVEYVGQQLAENKLYKDKTLKQKLKVYNSVNPNYYSGVTKLMGEMPTSGQGR